MSVFVRIYVSMFLTFPIAYYVQEENIKVINGKHSFTDSKIVVAVWFVCSFLFKLQIEKKQTTII